MSSGGSSSRPRRKRRMEVRLSSATVFASHASAPQQRHSRSFSLRSAPQRLQNPRFFIAIHSPERFEPETPEPLDPHRLAFALAADKTRVLKVSSSGQQVRCCAKRLRPMPTCLRASTRVGRGRRPIEHRERKRQRCRKALATGSPRR